MSREEGERRSAAQYPSRGRARRFELWRKQGVGALHREAKRVVVATTLSRSTFVPAAKSAKSNNQPLGRLHFPELPTDVGRNYQSSDYSAIPCASVPEECHPPWEHFFSLFCENGINEPFYTSGDLRKRKQYTKGRRRMWFPRRFLLLLLVRSSGCTFCDVAHAKRRGNVVWFPPN